MDSLPIEVMEIKDRETSLYLHLLFALKEKNLMYISAVFISSILDLLRFLEDNYKKLIKDIRTGSINYSVKIDSKVKENCIRCNYITNIFSIGIYANHSFSCSIGRWVNRNIISIVIHLIIINWEICTCYCSYINKFWPNSFTYSLK